MLGAGVGAAVRVVGRGVGLRPCLPAVGLAVAMTIGAGGGA